MNDAGNDVQDRQLMRKSTEVAIRLVLVGGLAFWCFLLFRPFLVPVVFGIVLAVALGPVFFRLASMLGGRRGLAATLLVLLGIGVVLVPAFILSESFLEGVRWMGAQEQKETIHVPPPPAGVAEWPLIGEQIHEVWTEASENLAATLQHFGPQVRSVGSWLLSTVAGFGVGLLMIIVAIIIAGVTLTHAEGGGRTAHAIGARLGGERGDAAVDLAVETIRSVASGVLGVAAVQAILAGAGMFLAGVPGAGIWTGAVLILAVAQLPPLLVLGPAIVYVLGTSDSTLTQVVFTIWSVVVSFSDTFLKPMFLGRGMDIPMPVILFGAIGGLIRAGIVGLFVGAVVLAIGYKMFTAWMHEAQT